MTIEYKVQDKVAWATLNRPEALNALNDEHLTGLLEVVDKVRNDAGVHVLVISGTGRAFSVGGDIKEMHGSTDEQFHVTANYYQRLTQELRALDKPVIAALNGLTLGGGLEVACMCDVRVAAASAKLGLPDAPLGFSPTGGLTFLLQRIIGFGRSLHMALDAEPVSAAEAERIGLVTRVTADEDFLADTHAFAAKVASWSRGGMARTKAAFYGASEASFEDTLALEARFDLECFQSAETRQALADFVESRKKK
ncbi:enoyl-CoA hydratase/isomerase family protein [Aliamphritea spongicola]|uniref:enoyl-CoA hydratase/isomerase family protein n=1 Tax=Aliamphritea spongicola TaxID=707589 RepID=UPI00196B108E|nr:enoyl-CoA hydratase-related protein [Aliamphritea spongicola]MBN3562390.1 enoyl-CoA hydratase/isomerase family protein [Aliamphritea spongicola]